MVTHDEETDTQGILRDIDQFLSEAKSFKLDNPKEFRELFKNYANHEVNTRLPEVCILLVYYVVIFSHLLFHAFIVPVSAGFSSMRVITEL